MPHYRLLTSLLSLATAHAVAFEWAGIFETPDDLYYWGAEKVDGAYADPAMSIVLIPAATASKAALKALEAAGNAAINGNCTAIADGGTLDAAANTCFRLVFSQVKHSSSFAVNATAVASVAFFTEHFPTEFERNAHYLKDVGGADIEPVAELPEDSKPKPWGVAIGAAVIVNILTFIGVLFLVPAFGRAARSHPAVLSVCVNSFAAGALLAAAFYLMLYEATHLIKPEGSSEPEQIAWWGSATLLGFFSVYLIDLVVSYIAGSLANRPPAAESTTSVEGGRTAAADKEMGDTKGGVDCATIEVLARSQPDRGRSTRVLSGILIGDFMHNFVDGIFIGVGFMLCNNSMGWTITAATIYHEIAQEIADYLILTDPRVGGLPPWKALLFNFLSGTSVLLGVVVFLARGSEDNFAMGIVLAIGGGIYLQIGAAECMPRVSESAQTLRLRVLALVVFALGAIAIGLVLLDHEHCAPDGGHAH